MKKLIPVLLLLNTAAFADDCQLEISGNDMMAFDKKEMSAPASCKEVTVTLKHTGKMANVIMGHNWVLSATGDMAALATDGVSAGLPNDYLPKDDKRVLAYTKVIGGGEETKVTFKTDGLAGKDLSFFCSFPGHIAMMKGSFTIK